MSEVKELIEDIKSVTADLRKEVELTKEKGKETDALTVAKFDKLNDRIDQLEEQKDRIETELNRKEFSPEAQKAEVVEDQAKFDKGMEKFLKTGDKAHMEAVKAELKTLVVNSDTNGGYFVSADRSGRIISQIFETSPIRQVAEVITLQTVSYTHLTLPTNREV